MLATYTATTTKGHRVDATCWQGSNGNLNFTVHINGCGPVCGTTDNDHGRSYAESEAEFQARLTASEIEDGTLRWINDEWRHVEAEELDRGNTLWATLQITSRDEWHEGGWPERVTEGSVWHFDGWNSIRNHMAVYGWVILGGDLYAKGVA